MGARGKGSQENAGGVEKKGTAKDSALTGRVKAKWGILGKTDSPRGANRVDSDKKGKVKVKEDISQENVENVESGGTRQRTADQEEAKKGDS